MSLIRNATMLWSARAALFVLTLARLSCVVQAQTLDPGGPVAETGDSRACEHDDCALAAGAQPSPVSPQNAPEQTGFTHGEAPYGWYGLAGLHLSRAFGRAAGSGFDLGAEGSVAFVSESFAWIGAYIDGVYAFDAKETRLSIGPEVGFLCLGVDGGYVLDLGGAMAPRPRHGTTLRVLLTLGIVSVFVRSSWLLGSKPDAFGEVGVLIKAPIELGRRSAL